MNAAPAHELRLALIGFGYAGSTFHRPLIDQVAGLQLTHIVSAKRDITGLSGIRVTNAVDDVFDDAAVDVVVIATPNDTHFDLTRRALLAGKHVVVDKPFTTTVSEARELVGLARESRRLLSVFHNRRWDADFLTLKLIIGQNRLGELSHCESHFDRFRPEVQQRWRERGGAGAGVWFDLGSHLADQALQLFGIPEGIYADMAAQRKGATTTDYFHVVLRYGASRVTLHGSSLVAAENPRFAIHGTRGSYMKYGLDTQETALRRGGIPGGAGWGEDPREGEIVTRANGRAQIATVRNIPGNYLAYYEGIRDALLHGKPNPVPPDEAVQVMAVLETAVESARRRQELAYEPVSLTP